MRHFVAWESLKYVVMFAAIAGVGYYAVSYPDHVLAAYRQVVPAPPEAPPPAPAPYVPIPQIAKADPGGAKPYEIGALMYIRGQHEVVAWGESQISVYYTYDGSAEDEKQAELFLIDHGTEIEIIDKAYSRGTSWYRVRTTDTFRKRGWVTGNYLTSKKPAPVVTDKDWGNRVDEVEKKKREYLEEKERETKPRGY